MFQCKCKSILRSAMFLLLMLSTLGFAADEFQPLTAQAALQVRMTGFRCNDGGQPGGEISYNWSTGELGNTWAEGEWVPYQIILTSIPPGLEGLDSLVVSFDFTRPQAGDFYRFVDLVRGIQAGTTELTDAQGWPWPDGSPFTVTPRESVEVAQNYPDIHEWPGFTFLNLPNERVNRTLTGGLDVPPGEDKHIFKIYKQDLLDAGIDPNATTVIIYCQLHESRTFIWENRLQANYDASPTDVWGGYLYGTDAWDTLSVFGAGYVPGASGHLHLENISGSKDVPIPIPERLPGAVSGLKWLDANGDGIKDELEPTLSGWQIHVSGMVEGINFTTSALTDGSGSYSFANLTAGTWTIKEDEQRDDPPETGYWETYPTVGTVFGQGTGVAVGPPPPDAAGVGWEVLLTLDITDQDSMNFGNRLCEMVCEVTPPDAEICDYSSQTFCVIPIDGIPPFTYQWSNGPTDSCITVSPGAGFYTYRVFVTDAAGCTTSCQATLTVNESPTCSVDPPSAEICDYSDQEFCVIPSGGTAPYTYAWDTGASDSCITVSESAGSYTYRVIVTDAEGCTTSCQATLTVNESPTCSVDPPSAEICDYSDQEFCVIPSGGTAPYTYAWDTGASDSCISVSESAGSYTYRVIVTDAEGCTTSCQATLTVNESPTCSVDPPSAEICDYSDQEFCVIPSGGTAPYTYDWSTGASDSCITASESAGSYTYRVIVTDAEGCTTSCQATLTVNESPTCSVDPPSAEICDYSDQEFCVIPSGGTAPYTYSWDTGASDSCITASESAGSYTYRVIVTDAEGCTTSCQATLTVNESPTCSVEPPSAEICDYSDQEFCVIPSGGTAPYTYSWDTGASDSCITVSESAGSYTYRVIVTDAEGCTTSCQATLTVNESPTCSVEPPSAEICDYSDQEFCVIPSGGTAPYTYSWDTGASDSCITVSESAGSYTYRVIVTDAEGCTTSCQATLTVNESPTCSVDPPSAEICDYSDQEFCVIPSGGTAPYTYAWDTGASDSCITVSESAGSYTYRVIVTDAEGCTTSCQATLTVNESPLCTVSPPNAEICDGEPQEFCVIPNGGTAPYTYDWSTGDTDSCIMVSPSPGSYTYRVVVTDAEGCTTSCEGTLTVYELPTCRIDPDSAKICTGDSQEFCVIPSGGTPPYTYLWSTGSADSCITVTPSEGSHTYSVVVTDDKGCVTSCEAILIVEPCGCTFTLGGWGSDCPGPQQNDRYSTQPGCIHDHFFDQVFPNGVWIGNPAAIVPTTSGATGTQTGTELMTGPAPMDGPGVAGAGLGVIGPSKAGASSVINGWYWLKWTSSTAVKTFLRSGGGPALALTQNLTNPDWAPTTTGNWGRQILALRLNVEFTCAGVFDSVGLVEGDYCYGDFIITSECGMGKFDGMSVYTFLAIADSAVGGLDVLGSYGADFSDVNYTATCLNELFDGCGSDEGIPIWQSAGAGAKPSSEEAGTRPDKFSLSQNYPNPFNPECNIDYAIPIDCHVRLSVYNVLGQKIRVLVDEQQSAGYKSVVWDGKDSQGQELTTGVYFYRIQAGDFVESRKMVLIK